MIYRFDRDLFARTLDEHRGVRTLADVSAETGISTATLSRIVSGGSNAPLPQLPTFAALCSWMQRDPNTFFHAPVAPTEAEFTPDLLTQLRSLCVASGITPQVATALQAMFAYAIEHKESQ